MQSAAMRRLDRVLRSVADKQVMLTFIGESGVGKEVLARRAHELSERRHGPFVPINCAAIPESLFESELFGHERGAFTGASERARGKIEAADGGTLFFDEIGEMPAPMQAKILRFLDNRRFMRVGGTIKLEADVRLMCATLRPLAQDVRAGRFRADLYYRIEGVTLHVPPLRERRSAIVPLIRQFIAEATARHRVEPPRLTRSVRAMLLQYDWPGNVRELRNLIERLCLLRGGRQVRLHDLPEHLYASQGPREHVAPAGEPLVLSLDDGLDAMLLKIVEAALTQAGGDTRRAAARLRISTRTIQRYIATGQVRVPVRGG
ncbi:sigma-54 interaction domain-containing protein [Nannocystis exedens]|uniref:sigma-54 interaction domain-containing protein n=1 Tax=Nannocystis exedens TaxID=54 RepID=UPI001474B14C|nr:sigma 54-interacting transcriptional regulator [Nannocystis exedens]